MLGGSTRALLCAMPDADTLMFLQALLARVFERCEQRWELYDPYCQQYELLFAALHSWQARAKHKRDKRLLMQQNNCADAFRYATSTTRAKTAVENVVHN